MLFWQPSRSRRFALPASVSQCATGRKRGENPLRLWLGRDRWADAGAWGWTYRPTQRYRWSRRIL